MPIPRQREADHHLRNPTKLHRNQGNKQKRNCMKTWNITRICSSYEETV